MKHGIKKLISTVLVLFLCVNLGTEIGFAANQDYTKNAASSVETTTNTTTNSDVRTISSAAELTEVIQANWDDSYFGEVVIDPETNTVSKDGTQTTLQDTLDLNKKDSATVMKSANSAEGYFSDSVYESESTKNGDVIVTAPFQTMRIVVSTTTLSDTYGAADALYYPEYNTYILQYDSQEATQQAYVNLMEKYGSDHCFLDEVVTQDELLLDTDTSQSASCYSWGATLMGLDHLKAQATTEANDNTVTVAVVDTGIDATNTLFSGKTILSSSRNFTESETNLSDATGHGTHVAGIVADCTPDNVALLILRVFDNDGKSTALTIFSALEYAVDQEVDVINLSFGWARNGASSNTRNLIDPVIDSAYQAGIPLFNAAGNETQNVETSYPACNTQTIAVSALNPDATFDKNYSNFGDKIDFSAPGVAITSAKAGGGVCVKTGTSMAAPHLSAAAAYIKLRIPEITVPELYQVLKCYAVDAGDSGKDTQYGWGYIQLASFYDNNPGGTHELSQMAATLSKSSYICDGIAKKPAVTLTENGTVVPDRNYTVTYKNNVAVGEATVTITGVGNYKGSITKTFSIVLGAASVSSVSNAKSGISVKWKKVPSASGYYVYRRTSDKSSKKWSKIASISSGKTVTFTDKTASNGTRYTYMVHAYCDDSVGLYHTTKTIYRLTRPTISCLKNDQSKRFILHWSRNSKASGYQIQYSTQRDLGSSKTITVSNYKTYKTVVSKLSLGKYYFVRVRSYKHISGSNYYSAWSPIKSVKINR